MNGRPFHTTLVPIEANAVKHNVATSEDAVEVCCEFFVNAELDQKRPDSSALL